MKTIYDAPQRSASLETWLDEVQMSETRREVARNQVRMTEALIDGVWTAAAIIRGAILRAMAGRSEPEMERREPSIRWH